MGENSTSRLSRRRLLKNAAKAGALFAAAPMFIPGRALGKDGAIPPSERITFGAIGIGGKGAIIGTGGSGAIIGAGGTGCAATTAGTERMADASAAFQNVFITLIFVLLIDRQTRRSVAMFRSLRGRLTLKPSALTTSSPQALKPSRPQALKPS